MKAILIAAMLTLSVGCQSKAQTEAQSDANVRPIDAGIKDASTDSQGEDFQLVDPTDHPDFVGC